MDGFEAERTHASRLAAIFIVVLGAAHFALGTRTHAVHGLHVVLAGLFLIPILIAAQAFAVRGALLAALVSGGVYLTHLLWSWRDSPMANADQFGMIGIYFVVAVAAGRLVRVAEWRKSQRDEIIRRSNLTLTGERGAPR